MFSALTGKEVVLHETKKSHPVLHGVNYRRDRILRYVRTLLRLAFHAHCRDGGDRDLSGSSNYYGDRKKTIRSTLTAEVVAGCHAYSPLRGFIHDAQQPVFLQNLLKFHHSTSKRDRVFEKNFRKNE